jgi:adenine-specific DNA-methyltransferase
LASPTIAAMPTLEFKGKSFVYAHHLSVPFRELVIDAKKSLPVKGQKPALDDNLIIHGDNLHALKALLPVYAGKVDCIYIDPPYNTGNEGWCYNDNVRSPLMREWIKKSGNPVEREDLERHDKWLSMMWPRLKILRELLADEGAFFISIGDQECHRVRQILDEIFGEEQFVATFVWKSRAKPSNIGDKKKKPQQVSEYVICYTKAIKGDDKIFGLIESGEERSYPHKLGNRAYRLQTILKSNRGTNERDTMRFEVAGYRPPPDQRWQGGEKHINKLHDTGYIEFRDGTPFLRYFEDEEGPEHNPLYTFIKPALSGTAEHGKIELNEILGSDHGLDTVKPLSLLNWLFSFATTPESIILDSFAGSGTTAHSVLELNNKDGGNRKFILVETEDYADKLTAERVRRVIQGYKFEGKQRDELLREPLNWTKLQKAAGLVEKIESIEKFEGSRFDKVTKSVEDGDLVVTGEKNVSEKVEGIGGNFTFATLGAELTLDKLLADGLPAFESLAKYVFFTATGRTLSDVAKQTAKTFGYIGETDVYRVHLHYQPEKNWLQSNDAALTEKLVDKMVAANKGKKKLLVFAAAKFMSQRELSRQGVEFCQLPYAIHRILGD